MTMNSIIVKLRRENIRHYYMLIFCTILSVLLISSYSVMYFSKTVQEILPEGGDSRKQGMMLFAISIAGCAAFSTYAATLFFKYKSKEYGILMALGLRKEQLRKMLVRELTTIMPICTLVGLLLSIPASYGIWRLLQVSVVDTKEMAYRLNPSSLLMGAAFCLFIMGCIFLQGLRFLRRSNIMDIIYEQRKSEMVKEVKPWTGKLGWAMVVGGFLLGYVVPYIVARAFDYLMPSIWNVTYLLSLLGIYLIMLHAVAYFRKGRNAKKYYTNIVSINILRFTGKQTVKNLCVIVFLIGAAVFAMFYAPTAVVGMLSGLEDNPVDYSFYYKATEKQVTKREIEELARKYEVTITSYYETQSISLITDGELIDVGNDNKIQRTYKEKMASSEFFSESEFNRISGKKVSVDAGKYLTIIYPNTTENIYTSWSRVSRITHPVTNETESISYSGTVEYAPLYREGSTKYIISDEDYARLQANLPLEYVDQFVLFNVKNPDETYVYANELKNQIILRSSQESAVVTYFNDYESKAAKERGAVYDYDEYKLDLSPDNTQLYLDWKYYPQFKVLSRQDLFKNFAVYLMMFIYITIICLASVAVITYTRSITIGEDNRRLFFDLRKLGANDRYIECVIKKQLGKVFLYPTMVGSVIMLALYGLILYGNDGRMIQSEIVTLCMDLALVMLVYVFMYGIYRLSLTKVKRIAQIG
ncbi:MAG TPA: ABC transporter permease [Lachnospiraceae bacterium]|nr:ABC transporter permease [Lachnospiraceae bacterium]